MDPIVSEYGEKYRSEAGRHVPRADCGPTVQAVCMSNYSLNLKNTPEGMWEVSHLSIALEEQCTEARRTSLQASHQENKKPFQLEGIPDGELAKRRVPPEEPINMMHEKASIYMPETQRELMGSWCRAEKQ